MSTPTGTSRRWEVFEAALKDAIERSAHKWTYEDFAECFPQYAEEDKTGSMLVYNRISDYIQQHNLQKVGDVFQHYKAKERIDVFHQIVNDAKDRHALKEEPERKDIWKEELSGSNATHARTVPVLRQEVKRLRETLTSLEEENRTLLRTLEDNVAATYHQNQQSVNLLNQLTAANNQWEEVPQEELEAWAIDIQNYLHPPRI